MGPIEYQWKSFDGLNLYAVQWPAKEQPEAVVAFVHGHGEHCRRYDEWFKSFTENHIAVLTFDYRGHGRSEGKKGCILHFDNLCQDVTLLHQNAQKLFPGIPVVLYGHSLGATMVLSYILRSGTQPAIAIATSPWLHLIHQPSKIKKFLISIASRIAPWVTAKTGLHVADFATSPSNESFTEKDAFLHNKISPRLYTETEKEIQYIITKFPKIKTPLLLMQGRDDQIMDSTVTAKLLKKAPGQVSYREWKYAGHQLHNSERSKEVNDYILDWIKGAI